MVDKNQLIQPKTTKQMVFWDKSVESVDLVVLKRIDHTYSIANWSFMVVI